MSAHPTGGELLTSYVAEQVDRLEQQDQLLRGGDPEGVHQLRVAARRLRSALTTFAPILEPEDARGLRSELRWFGGVLAEARDAQVLRERLARLVAEQPPELVLGPVTARITDELQERFRVGRARADEALGSERYLRLLDRLGTFLATPPFLGSAGDDARDLAPELVQAELDALRRRDRSRRRAGSQEDRDLAFHEVRKSAKRLRYAAETVRPVVGEEASRLATRAEAVQELLGDHQDSVVSRAFLREVGARAHAVGEDAFTYGLLHARESCRAVELENSYEEVLAGVPGTGIALTRGGAAPPGPA